MKISLFFIYLILLCSIQLTNAQEYFVLVVKNDSQSFKYSEYVIMNLIDEKGNIRLIKKNDAITVKGNYTLEIKSPQNDDYEIIESDGGILEIFMLPIENRNSKVKTVLNDSIENVWKAKIKSYISIVERSEITKSQTIEGFYNILIVFENGLGYSYIDGDVRAWENSDEVFNTNVNLLHTTKGILKITFNPKTLETHWIWE